MKALKRFFIEYLLLNSFIFGCVGLLSLVFLNLSFFDPFTQAFEDLTLTDLYYSKIKNRDSIYAGPLVLVNIGNRDRSELAAVLERVAEGKPRVIGLDVIFRERRGPADSLLQQVFARHPAFVFSHASLFDPDGTSVRTDSFFTRSSGGYANLVGSDRENATIRYFHPFFRNEEAFTTTLIHQFDPGKYRRIPRSRTEEVEIHYWGNLANFRYYQAGELLDPSFDLQQLEDKLLVVGYLGPEGTDEVVKLDEDKFFTPLNDRLSGRSYPDMYGSVIHANILRMMLEEDYVRVVPPWKVILISSLAIWLLLPVMGNLFLKGDIWFNAVGTLVQLTGSILIVFVSILVYRYFNIKFDPGLLTACLVLLPTFINLYEAFLMFLHYKLKLPFRSQFLGKPAS